MSLLPYLILAVTLLGMLLQSRLARAGRVAGATPAEWLWRAARWLYGGYFLFVALMVVRILWFGAPGVHEPTAASKAFADAMNATGFFNPLLMVDYALGGGALLFRRTAPLGLALLAPPIVVIFLFHLVLTGNVAWGGGWALDWGLLALRYRAGFAGLWSYAAEPFAAIE
jgi:hypothetical protein